MATTSPLQGSNPRSPLHGRGPAAVAVFAAFATGALLGAVHVPAEREVAERYLSAWERGDSAAMHALLTPDARRAVGLDEFRATLWEARSTATATDLAIDEPEVDDGVAVAVATVPTLVFGELEGDVRLSVADVDGEARIAWRPHHAFPGLRPGERLSRRTDLPERGNLLARDGTPLAVGELRTSELGAVASAVVGELGAIPPARADRLRSLGWPADAQVGIAGLERAFDERLAGRPGGELMAGERLLASARPRPGEDVRTSVSVAVQQAAVEALAGRLGGIVALDPTTGEVLASSGIGLEGLQPPGSTFKVITLAGALEAGITQPGRRYEPTTSATLEGVELQNADGALCGGTLLETFARSCNSVYAPMGAQLGAQRLVEAAEDFGFNAPPGIDGAAVSTIPPADEIGDDLAVGATAIGQGRVQATALQMALVSAVIAREGVLPQASFLVGGSGVEGQRTIPAGVARTVERLMVAVVEKGTGDAGAIPGVRVAGKTGTAELRATQGGTCPPVCGSNPADTSAWFITHAPAGSAEAAVAVLLVQGGSGGETAAPAAAAVLRAALRRRG
ncbi:MAG TPA: penicillin-binding transpeptidase domain-containing protein [Solirubrobacteraceae bacterium]|nr:penicillin-binding transpeptidase domain-containing protein [Solirubrobacteraceae bacterium]